MPRPDDTPDSRAHQNGVKPLPLFRPEALLYHQQKSYGEIILIRPLSLALLTWLALAIVALALGFLFFGHYTEKTRVSGSLLSEQGDGSNRTELQAEIYLPASRLALVPPGTSLVVRCRSCPSQNVAHVGTVLRISERPSNFQPPPPGPVTTAEPMYKVTVSLPAQALQMAELSHPPQSGMPVEAEIPVGRKPLIKWLFERSGS